MDLVFSTLMFMAISIIGGMLLMSPENVFGQMESMTIEGTSQPYVDTVFNIGVDVDGVSRASGGIFRTVMTIFEKETGNEILAVPDYLRSGINTIQINMIPDRNHKPMIEGITYILQIQHVNIISQHEFTPKPFSETGTKYTVEIKDGISSSEKIKPVKENLQTLQIL